MFRLPDQIGGDNRSIRGAISDHQTIGWTRDHINTDTAEQYALGLGHKLIARPDNDIRLRQTKQSEGHRGHALNPAHGQNLIGTAVVGRIDNCWRNACVFGRR